MRLGPVGKKTIDDSYVGSRKSILSTRLTKKKKNPLLSLSTHIFSADEKGTPGMCGRRAETPAVRTHDFSADTNVIRVVPGAGRWRGSPSGSRGFLPGRVQKGSLRRLRSRRPLLPSSAGVSGMPGMAQRIQKTHTHARARARRRTQARTRSHTEREREREREEERSRAGSTNFLAKRDCCGLACSWAGKAAGRNSFCSEMRGQEVANR